eukprot:COSAG02_NODE_6804_length_3351_cov_7.268696_1_plen_167_part_10
MIPGGVSCQLKSTMDNTAAPHTTRCISLRNRVAGLSLEVDTRPLTCWCVARPLFQGGALLREHAPNTLPGLSELVAKDTTDNSLRVSVMHMLAEIVHRAGATHDDATAVAAMLQPKVGELLVALAKLARMPFADVKHAALHLLEALGARPWALPALCGTPGLLDQLL